MYSAQELRDDRDDIRSQIEVLESDIKDRKGQVKNLKGSLEGPTFMQVVSEVHGIFCTLYNCNINNLDYRCVKQPDWVKRTEKLLSLFSAPSTTKAGNKETSSRGKRKLQFDETK